MTEIYGYFFLANEINATDRDVTGPTEQVQIMFPLKDKNINYYYIDESVLLENIPLVKFIKTTSGTRVVYFP